MRECAYASIILLPAQRANKMGGRRVAAFGRRRPCIFVALWLFFFVPSSSWGVRSRGGSDGRREDWRTAAAAAQQRFDRVGFGGQVAAVHVCPLNRCCSNDLGRCEDGRTLTLAERSVAVGFLDFFFSSSMTTCAAFLRSSFFAVLSLFLFLSSFSMLFCFVVFRVWMCTYTTNTYKHLGWWRKKVRIEDAGMESKNTACEGTFK